MPPLPMGNLEKRMLEVREIERIISQPDFDPAEFPPSLTRRLIALVDELRTALEAVVRESLYSEAKPTDDENVQRSIDFYLKDGD